MIAGMIPLGKIGVARGIVIPPIPMTLLVVSLGPPCVFMKLGLELQLALTGASRQNGSILFGPIM